jgi:hypothetical protein
MSFVAREAGGRAGAAAALPTPPPSPRRPDATDGAEGRTGAAPPLLSLSSFGRWLTAPLLLRAAEAAAEALRPSIAPSSSPSTSSSLSPRSRWLSMNSIASWNSAVTPSTQSNRTNGT